MIRWENKETQMVSDWYMDCLPEYFAEMKQYHVEPKELEETVTYLVEESEALSQLPCGLLKDFISECWGKVSWNELASHLNACLTIEENQD